MHVDRSLLYGLRSAPKLFIAVADTMAWTLFLRGIGFLLHYLYDFLFLAPPGSQEASRVKELATVVFRELGTPVTAHKTEGPSTQVTFLGFGLDTDAF